MRLYEDKKTSDPEEYERLKKREADYWSKSWEERLKILDKKSDEASDIYYGKRTEFSIDESSMIQGDIGAYIYNASFDNDYLADY